MNKVLLVVLFLCFFSSLAFAQATDDAVVMNGTIVDVQSAANNKDNLADFINNYTKKDALVPDAIAGGYGIFMGDSYMKFDNESNAKVVEFLNKPESTLEVTVKVNIGENNILSLVSIQNK